MHDLDENRSRHASSQAGDDGLRLYRRQLNDRDYEVRLLELYEYSTSEPGHAFKCRLRYLSLKDSLQYVALSYCWGDLPNIKDIVVGNVNVPVSETLLSALEQLWQMGNTLIWVDYLCINQDDNDEKSGQVRMMDIIYSKATTVFAWLGTGDYDSDMAMAVLGASRLSEQVELPEEIEIACDAVIRLFSRPYWTRCWVIQEICRARSPVIVCGGRSVPWGTMLKRLDGLGTSVPAQYAQHLISPLRQMRYREQNKLRAGTEISLVPLLVLSRRSLARDPRDKLYALLSLAKDGRTLIPTPNYSQTAEQIFFDTARCMIEDHDRTDVILLAHRTRGVRNLPSWTPDWANMHSQPPPWVLECLSQRRPGRVIRNKIYKDTLEVQGIRYATIVDLLDSAAYENKRGPVTGPHPPVTEGVAESAAVNLFMGLTIGGGAELDQTTAIRALSRMCDANDGHNTQRPSRLRNWVAHNANRLIGGATLARCLEIYLRLCMGPNYDGSNSTDADTLERTQSAIEKGFETLERLRMIFSVTHNGLLRIVHRDTKRGDAIYILQNCPLPVILRPQNARDFGFVGEAFVSQRFKDMVVEAEMSRPATVMVPVRIK
ncbi:HET-domain-containing protein [Xylaria cf. heliscus]|nr:HET-domain-containing protein [Xylaria cf. heliscus]